MDAQKIIAFYLFPHTLKDTAVEFGLSYYLVKKLLTENQVPLHSKLVLSQLTAEATKKAFEIKYGVNCPFELDLVKQQCKESFRERYGVDNPAKSPEVQLKIRQTDVERYGAEYLMQCKDLQNKAKQTKQERYGDANYRNIEQAKQTNLDRYGTEWAVQATEVQEKIKTTNLKRFGTEYPISLPEIQSKIKQTFIQRYGVEHNSQLESFKHNLHLLWQTAGYREQIEQKLVAKYGIDSYFKSAEYKELMAKMNADCEYQKARVEKINQTKKQNGTFNTSKPEKNFGKLLADFFGIEDVSSQYSTDIRYPFVCDFYIKSLDLFIELNFSWTHGGKLFEGTAEDLAKLELWKQRSANSRYYINAINTWTKRDVKKQETAKANQLNYLVFYKESDAIDWLNTLI